MTKKKKKRNIVFSAIKWLAVLLLVASFFIAPVYWLLHTSHGVRWLATTALPTVVQKLPGHYSIAAEGIEGSSVSDMRIGLLTISDTSGIWLEMRDIRLIWHPYRLLRGRVETEKLSARTLDIFRLPEETDIPENAADALKQVMESLDSLPDTLEALSLPPIIWKRLSIGVVTLHEGLLARKTSLKLLGHAQLLHAPYALSLSLSSMEGIATSARANLIGTLDAPRLELEWHEEKDGLLGSLMQLAEPSAITLSATTDYIVAENRLQLEAVLKGNVPLATANATLNFESSATEKLKGHAVIETPSAFSILSIFNNKMNADFLLKEENGMQPVIEISTNTQSLQLGDTLFSAPEVTASATFSGWGQTMQLVAKASANIMRDGKPIPLLLDVKAEGDNTTWEITSLNVQAEESSLQTTGHLNVAEGALSLQGDALLRKGAQALHSKISASLAQLWQAPTAEADITLTQIEGALPRKLRQILSLPIKSKIQYDDTGNINLFINSKNLNGKGTFHAGRLDAGLRANTLHWGAFTPASPVDFTLHHTTENNGTFTIATGSWKLASDYRLAAPLLTLQNLTLQGGEPIVIAGNIDVNYERKYINGSISGDIISLSPLKELTNFNAPPLTVQSGKLHLLFTPEPKQKQQRATAEYAVTHLRDEEKEWLANATLSGNLAIPLSSKGEPIFTAQVMAGNVSHPLQAKALEVGAEGTANDITYNFIIKNPNRLYQLAGKGDVKSEEKITAITLQNFSGKWRDTRYVLPSPAQVMRNGSAWQLHPTILNINKEAELHLQGLLSDTEARADMEIRHLPLSALPSASFQHLIGVANGAFHLEGAPEAPNARFTFDVDKLQHNYPTTTRLHKQPLTVRLEGELGGHMLKTTLSAHAPQESSYAEAILELPLELSLKPDDFYARSTQALNGFFKADLSLAPFLPLFLPDGTYGAGHLIADLKISGMLDAPDIHGKIDLHDGQVELLRTGTLIENLTLNAVAEGKRITLGNATATDGKNGKIRLNGYFSLAEPYAVDISAALDKATLLRHKYASATLTGQSHLRGNRKHATIDGKWEVENARFTIQTATPSAAPELDVVEVPSLTTPVTTPAQKPEQEGAGQNPTPFDKLELDIGINAGNQVFLEGYGLEAELKGALGIKGTAAKPKIDGALETVRGRYSFFGKTFSITRGKALLTEATLTAPLLDIEAQSTSKDFTALVNITGTAAEPKLAFSSIPSRPQDEILSRVLFGKNLSSISPFQAIQLAEVLRSLSGKGSNGFNPFGKVKDVTGIDELKINNNSGNTDDVTVGVGKYVQENIYLEVEGGAAENSGKVSLEVDITPNISVETETRQNAESAVRLNYKHDY